MEHVADGADPDQTPDTDLSNNPKVAEFDYTVAANGQRTAMTERFWIDDDATADVVNSYSWTYDGLNRLTDEVFTTNLDDVLDGVSRAQSLGLADPSTLTGGNRAARDYHDHYSFDLTGNRLSKAMDLGNDGSVEEVTNSTYDANDRLLVEQVPHTLPPGVPGPEQVSRRTTYGYDHTQQTDKTIYSGADVNDPSTMTSSMHFAYDLQGRLSVATNSTFNGSDGTRLTAERTSYGYDATGIRVSATTETLDPADATNGTVQATERVEFLNDPQNFTGYSQVIRETHKDGAGNPLKTVVYTFGHDEISQTTQTYDANGTVTETRTEFFAHDGHGSVRALLDAAGAIATVVDPATAIAVRQLFTYDAWGNALGFDMVAVATVLLYSGEQFDQHAMMQYLRARYYDQTNGRLPMFDPVFGDGLRPTTFHKYAYTSGDPIRFVDPSGMSELIGMLMSMSVGFSNRGNQAPGQVGVLVNAQRFQKVIHIAQKLLVQLQKAKDALDFFTDITSLLDFTNADQLLLQNAIGPAFNAIPSTPIGPLQITLPQRLTDKLRFLVTVARQYGVLNLLQEQIGEWTAAIVSSAVGLRPSKLKLHKPQGIDQLRRNDTLGFWAIIEAKGGRSRLGTSNYGDEMSPQWIRHWLNDTINNNFGNSERNDLIQAKTLNQPMIAAIVRANVERKTWQIKVVHRESWGLVFEEDGHAALSFRDSCCPTQPHWNSACPHSSNISPQDSR